MTSNARSRTASLQMGGSDWPSLVIRNRNQRQIIKAAKYRFVVRPIPTAVRGNGIARNAGNRWKNVELRGLPAGTVQYQHVTGNRIYDIAVETQGCIGATDQTCGYGVARWLTCNIMPRLIGRHARCHRKAAAERRPSKVQFEHFSSRPITPHAQRSSFSVVPTASTQIRGASR